MTFRAAYFPDTGPSYRGTVTVHDDGTGVFVSDQIQKPEPDPGEDAFSPDAGTFSKALDAQSIHHLLQLGQSGTDRLIALKA